MQCANILPLPQDPDTTTQRRCTGVIRSSTSTAKGFAHEQATAATREHPRFVTREALEAFEQSNPALKGISSIMLERGIWVITEPTAASEDARSSYSNGGRSDGRTRAATA